MTKIANYVNAGGQKSLNNNNSNNLDQKNWPMVLRTQI